MKHLLLLTFAMLFAFNISAQDTEKKLKLYGDVRFRVEADRNSNKNMKDEQRADRDRLRYRARFGFKYNMTDNFEFGMRIRSGNPANQQSPHVTLGNGFDSAQLNIDKAYIKVKSNNGLWAWAGKNSMPFWEQNELLWDGDVNPEGISFGGKFKMSETSKLAPVVGYYILANNTLTDTDGNSAQTFGNHSKLMLAQLKYCNKFGSDKLTLSSGIVNAKMTGELEEDTDDFSYNIWATSLQYKMNDLGLTAGVDYFSNLEDYKDKLPEVYQDQKTGYAASLKYSKNNFGAAFTYASIQKYAVVDMFAQDDWVRWGNNEMTRSSNFKGFELNFKYKFTDKFNSTLRFWNVEGLEFHNGGNQLETGTRVRLDFNIKF